MDDIIIPGFRIEFPNDTYLKRIIISSEKKLYTNQIVQLEKYLVPTNEEILECIKRAAELSLSYGGRSPLGKYIKKHIPDHGIRTRIADKEEEIFEVLQKSIPYLYEEAGKTYLKINSGIICDEYLRKIDGKDIFPEDFSRMIKSQGDDRVNISIRLENGLYLPSEEEIDSAFNERTFRSSFMIVNLEDPFLYEELKKLSKKIYRAIRKSSLVGIANSSEIFEMKIAKKTLRNYIDYGHLFEEHLDKMATKVKKNMRGPKDISGDLVYKFKYDFKDPFSKN